MDRSNQLVKNKEAASRVASFISDGYKLIFLSHRWFYYAKLKHKTNKNVIIVSTFTGEIIIKKNGCLIK